MPRNLDHRIEVVVPVEDPKAQQELNDVFETLLADNIQAWVLAPDGSWERVRARARVSVPGRPTPC